MGDPLFLRELVCALIGFSLTSRTESGQHNLPAAVRYFPGDCRKHVGRLRCGRKPSCELGGDGGNRRGEDTAALVRLRRQPDRAVQVRSCAVKNRAVSNRNCVAARRGGEQRNENDQSVTQEAPRGASAVNSIRSAWVDESAREGRSRSRRANPAGRRAIPGHPADGWRQNGRQSGCPNQGDPPVLGVVKDQQSAQPAGGSQSVRSSEEAGNDRGAKGTQEGGSNTNGKSETDRRECRKAGPRRSRPGVNNRRGDDHPNGWCLGTRRRAAPLSQETH